VIKKFKNPLLTARSLLLCESPYMKTPTNTPAREDILERCSAVTTEVLPECLPPSEVIEGSSEVNTHLNAGGSVRKATPEATYAYFSERFGALVA